MLKKQHHVYIHVHVCISQWRRTPLHGACNGGHTTTVQLLLEAESDVNARDNVSVVLVLYMYMCESRGSVKKCTNYSWN